MSTVYYIIIGFLLASGVFTLLLPNIWRLSNYSSLRKIEEKNPISLDEFQADKDKLRAEFASDTHHMSMTIEKMRQKNATLSIENANAKKHINKLHNYVVAAQNKIKAQQEKIIFLKKEFNDNEKEQPNSTQTLVTMSQEKNMEHLSYSKDEPHIDKTIKESQQEIVDVYIEKLSHTNNLLHNRTIENEQMSEKIKIYQDALKEKNIYESEMEKRIEHYKIIENDLKATKTQMIEYEKFIQDQQKKEAHLIEKIKEYEQLTHDTDILNKRQIATQKEKLETQKNVFVQEINTLKKHLEQTEDQAHHNINTMKKEHDEHIISLNTSIKQYKLKNDDVISNYKILEKQLKDHKNLSKRHQDNYKELKRLLKTKHKELQDAWEAKENDLKTVIEQKEKKIHQLKNELTIKEKNIKTKAPNVLEDNTTSLTQTPYNTNNDYDNLEQEYDETNQSLINRIKKLRPTVTAN